MRLLQTYRPILLSSQRTYSTAPTTAASPHPSLTLLPSFLSIDEQRLLLGHSLTLLALPSRTTSRARKLARDYRRTVNSAYDPGKDGFMPEQYYEFERGHFDGVITSYREMLVREGMAPASSSSNAELINVLQRCYSLLPPPPASDGSTTASEMSASRGADPPSHLIMHVLHLSGAEGRILPHVDNLEAFGRTIIGISLGSERIMRFKRTSDTPDNQQSEGPDEFQVSMKPGDAYIQREPLRTHYTHEIPLRGEHEGREVGGEQRLSIMLRDQLPIQDPDSASRPSDSGPEMRTATL